MRSSDSWARATPLACGLASLVLVFGLVAPPLLVQCIREDGRVLIEFAGQDMCHEESRQEHLRSGVGRGPTPRVAAGQWHDPCLDLSLYKPAVAQAGANLVQHPSDAVALETGAPAACTLLEGHGAVHKPPPKLRPPTSDPAFLPLRI